ncbi:hypothetical protein EXIGLDRAFT_378720 [Exidia glandulosa HHB12029]|uniref:Uncharacterized protein n=1 Tax=Exidia glandulosa HHB12029 TaxID=1314781 RepID=A0A165L4Y8_EXIGL|nr:hypothetical protein EXIGLDRAFT_378720 [Exidia glandulosa HHB12029]
MTMHFRSSVQGCRSSAYTSSVQRRHSLLFLIIADPSVWLMSWMGTHVVGLLFVDSDVWRVSSHSSSAYTLAVISVLHSPACMGCIIFRTRHQKTTPLVNTGVCPCYFRSGFVMLYQRVFRRSSVRKEVYQHE